MSAHRAAAWPRSAARAGSRTAASRAARTGPARRQREHRWRDGSRRRRRRARRAHRVVRPRLEAALQLEHAVAVDLAPEVAREETLRLGPVVGELPGRCGANADPRTELDLGHDRDPDERCNGRVRMRRAEERALELGVGTLERGVVPVEATARLGGRDQQREQHGAEERLLLGRSRPGVRAREDRRGRLRRSSSSAIRASSRPSSALARDSTNVRTSGRYSYSAGPSRWTCSSKANGKSSPSSSARPRKTKAPRQNERRVRCSCGLRTAIRLAYSPGGPAPA